MVIQASTLAAKRKVYTFEDYLKLPQEERVEVIEEQIYNMTPAPV